MSAPHQGPAATLAGGGQAQGAGSPSGPEADEAGYPPPAVAWSIVVVLFVAYIFSFIDRMIIGLLVEPMKADLKISDTQISLLQGLAFAIFYTFAGLPLGRLIDRAARMKIVAAGVAVWSLATAACGLTTQYWQLFAARMGVGVGEATLSPAAYSIIADSFPRRRLGLAMGFYGLGSAVGAGLAFMIGAAVIQFAGEAGSITLPALGEVQAWQLTFLVVGLPGLAVALVFLVLPEPARRLTAAETGLAQISVADTVRFVGKNAPAILGLCFGVAMVNLAVLGGVSWYPAMLIRTHGLSLTEAGQMAGGALILGGLIGTIGGGWLSDRRQGGAAHARLTLCALLAIVGTIAGAVFPLAPSALLSGIVFTLFFSCAAFPIGAAATALQQLTPNRMRATISALYIFIVNIIGLGVGPTATAVVGDTFFPGGDGIRYAIALVGAIGFACAGLLFVVAARAAARHDGAISAG